MPRKQHFDQPRLAKSKENALIKTYGHTYKFSYLDQRSMTSGNTKVIL
jgi:hypothetical protein